MQLEQMELEVREMKPTEQTRQRTKMASYRAELGRLQQEFKRARSGTTHDGKHSKLYKGAYCVSIKIGHVTQRITTEQFVNQQ